MDQGETLANPVTDRTEQSHTMCPNKNKQELGSEAVSEASDDLNKSGVDDGFDSDKHITNRTPNEIREKLGFNSEDVQDGLLKWITGCAGSRSKLIDEDNETYGFSDMESREKTINGRLRRQFSERRSRRAKHTGMKYSRSKSNEDEKRTLNSERKNSYKEAVNINNDLTPLNNTVNTWNENQRVPLHTNVINDLRSPRGVGINMESNRSYPFQTNIQSHPSTSQRKRDQPIIDPDVYSFTNPARGYLVNIVNESFTKQARREGADQDLLNMIEIGEKFGFQLFNYNNDTNLTKQQTMSLLTEVQHADHSQCDCFMLMISTHGMEQPNPTLRGKMDHALMCADDGLIFTSTILNMFNDSNCPTLKGKPKIFFIQACRGERLDYGSADVYVVCPKGGDRTDVTIDPGKQSRRLNKKESVDESDTKPFQDSRGLQHGMKQVQYSPWDTSNTSCYNRNHVFQSQCESQPSFSGSPAGGAHIQSPFPLVDTPSLRCSNDMLVMYAVSHGLFAWRSQSDGSWMIYYLHQILMSYNMNRPKNFLRLLTKVSAVMSRRETNVPSSLELHKKKAIPVIEQKLDKDIIFQPKVPVAVLVKQVQQMSL